LRDFLQASPGCVRLAHLAFSAAPAGRTRHWLRDPLVVFVLLGAGVFALDGWLADSGGRPVIEITQQQVDHMRARWRAQWGREPTAVELGTLVAEAVDEEVLYREAQRLGLDRDDAIVRRRLAQKLTFILEDAGAANLQWGMAASPAILDGAVLTAPGGPNGAVIAYELATGEIRWRALNAQGAYTAPAVFTLDGLPQIVLIGGDQVISLATDGSTTYWTRPWETMNGINAAQPLQVTENRVFVSSGYGYGAALLEVDADPEANTAEVHEVWFSNQMKNRFSSSVLHEGYIYGLDEGILACIDPETGDRMWKGGRYGHGQLLLASGHLVITTERGHLALVRATPESLQEVATLPAVPGRTWNNPAIANGILLVRNDREAVAYDLRPQT